MGKSNYERGLEAERAWQEANGAAIHARFEARWGRGLEPGPTPEEVAQAEAAEKAALDNLGQVYQEVGHDPNKTIPFSHMLRG